MPGEEERVDQILERINKIPEIDESTIHEAEILNRELSTLSSVDVFKQFTC